MERGKQEWTMKGTLPINTILTKAATALGLKIDIKDKVSGTLTDFQVTGDGKALLRALQWACPDHAVFVRKDTLTVVKKDRDEPGPGETVWTIREDTGLINIPSAVLPKGIDCDVLLNPNILPGDWMKLESIHQPAANGIYRISRVRHHGELRGNDFLTSLETFRPVSNAKR